MKKISLTLFLGVLLLASCGKEKIDATVYVGKYEVKIAAPYEFEWYRTANSRIDLRDTMTVQLAGDNYTVTATGSVMSGSGAINDTLGVLLFQPQTETLRYSVSVGIMGGLTFGGELSMVLNHPQITLNADSTYYEAPITGMVNGHTTDYHGYEVDHGRAEISGNAHITIRRL